MTDCNGCGRCCSPVVMPYSQAEVMRAPWGAIEPDVRRWVLEDLTLINRKEGLKAAEYLSQGGKTAVGVGLDGAVILWSYFYSCRWYDEAERLCTNYENRPSVCSLYPWYGEAPDPSKAIPPECEFNADVGRPVKMMPTRR